MECHTECVNNQWKMQERNPSTKGIWIDSPHIKIFDCLAEARKGLITYIKNSDFKDYEFKLKILQK